MSTSKNQKGTPRRLCVACYTNKTVAEFASSQWKKHKDLPVTCRDCRDLESELDLHLGKQIQQKQDFFKATQPCPCCHGRGRGITHATSNIICRLCVGCGRVDPCVTCSGEGMLVLAAPRDRATDEAPPRPPRRAMCPSCMSCGVVSPDIPQDAKRFVPQLGEEHAKEVAKLRDAKAEEKKKSQPKEEKKKETTTWSVDSVKTWKHLVSLATPNSGDKLSGQTQKRDWSVDAQDGYESYSRHHFFHEDGIYYGIYENSDSYCMCTWRESYIGVWRRRDDGEVDIFSAMTWTDESRRDEFVATTQEISSRSKLSKQLLSTINKHRFPDEHEEMVELTFDKIDYAKVEGDVKEKGIPNSILLSAKFPAELLA